jgi:excisionase family DNA binding protein
MTTAKDSSGERLGERLLSVKEAGDYLRISAQGIYNRINQGRITYSKIGGRVVIKLSTLEKLVEQGQVSARKN